MRHVRHVPRVQAQPHQEGRLTMDELKVMARVIADYQDALARANSLVEYWRGEAEKAKEKQTEEVNVIHEGGDDDE